MQYIHICLSFPRFTKRSIPEKNLSRAPLATNHSSIGWICKAMKSRIEKWSRTLVIIATNHLWRKYLLKTIRCFIREIIPSNVIFVPNLVLQSFIWVITCRHIQVGIDVLYFYYPLLVWQTYMWISPRKYIFCSMTFWLVKVFLRLQYSAMSLEKMNCPIWDWVFADILKYVRNVTLV